MDPFTSISGDSLVTGLIINQVINDTAQVIMASITQQDQNEFDLFLAVLRYYVSSSATDMGYSWGKG